MTTPATTPTGVRTAPTALDLPDQLDFDTWLDVGRQIVGVAEASWWWVGDWLVYADDHFTQGSADDARIRQAVADIARLDPILLANARRVARRYPPTTRRRALSWQHHARLADAQGELVEQLLDAAEREGWTETQLAAERRKWEATDTTAVETAPVKVKAAIRVTVPAGAEGTLREVLEEEADRIRERLAELDPDVTIR